MIRFANHSLAQDDTGSTFDINGSMKNTRKHRKPLSAEAVARLADQGMDVSPFFTNAGCMGTPSTVPTARPIKS